MEQDSVLQPPRHQDALTREWNRNGKTFEMLAQKAQIYYFKGKRKKEPSR